MGENKKKQSKEEIAKACYDKGLEEGIAWAIGQPLAKLKEYSVGLTYPYRDIVAFPEIEEAKKKYIQDYEFNSRSWQHGWFDGVKQVISSRDKVSLNDD